MYFNEGWKRWCCSRSAQLILESKERRSKTSVFYICKSCNAHQGFHDIFLISGLNMCELWGTDSRGQASKALNAPKVTQHSATFHWFQCQGSWTCWNSGEMSIEFKDKSQNLFRSIQTQSSRAASKPGFPSYQAGKAFTLEFSARQDRKPGWIMAHEEWVWTRPG